MQGFPKRESDSVEPEVVTAAPILPAYASFSRRSLASFLDSVVYGMFGFIFGAALSFPFLLKNSLGTTFDLNNPAAIRSGFDQTQTNEFLIRWSVGMGIGLLITLVNAYLIGRFGQSLGKKLLGIKVVGETTGMAVGFWKALLRETLGKIASGILYLGFLWMLWDPKKQTWHDKIAGTVVVKS